MILEYGNNGSQEDLIVENFGSGSFQLPYKPIMNEKINFKREKIYYKNEARKSSEIKEKLIKKFPMINYNSRNANQKKIKTAKETIKSLRNPDLTYNKILSIVSKGEKNNDKAYKIHT